MRLGALLVLLVGVWSVGFGWFLHRVLEAPPPLSDAAGIVVLTGGSGRMGKGFRLLLAGYAPRLLISGVGRDTSLAEIKDLAGVPETPLGGRVDLGRQAASTAGNAREAAAWAAALQLGSLIVVTSFYHMPRAMLEFHAALPRVRLIPAPVAPRAALFAWPPALWQVVAMEYCKWLAAEAGLAGPFPWLHRGAP